MTWSVFTGSTSRAGSTAMMYRAAFEALPYEVVTHPTMVREGDPSENVAARVNGLAIRDQEFKFDVDIAQFKLTAGGITVGIADIGGVWTQLFTAEPRGVSWLAANMTDGGSETITLPDTDAITDVLGAEGVVYVDGEAIYYSSVVDNTLSGLTRGIYGSHAAYHYTASGEGLRSPEVTTDPTLLEQRRVSIYVYVDGDSPTGDGRLVWRGTVTSEPQSNGAMWTIQCDSIVSVLKQTLGGTLGLIQPRGIQIPETYPVYIYWQEVQSSLMSETSTAARTHYPVDPISGFFEDNDAWVAEVNAQIAATILSVGAMDGTLLAKSDGARGWHLEYTPGPLAYNVILQVTGVVDSILGPTSVFGWALPQLFSGTSLYTPGSVTADLTYYYYTSDQTAGTVPRGIITRGSVIYLTAPVPSAVTSAMISFLPDSGRTLASNQDASSDPFLVGSPDEAMASAYFVLIGPAGVVRHWTGIDIPTIRLGINFNTTIGAGGNSLFDLLFQVMTFTPELANLGLCPPLYEGEWNEDAYSVLSSGAVPPLVNARSYVSWTPKSLEATVTEELKLAGYIPGIDEDGALTITRLRLAAASEPGVIHITSDDILNDSSKLDFAKGAYGIWNTFSYKDGYDPMSGQFNGDLYVERDIAASSRGGANRIVSSTPFSMYIGPQPVSINDLQALVSATLGVLGVGYTILTLEVNARFWDVVIGDTVSIAYRLLPSTGGVIAARTGIPTTRTGIVVGWSAGTYSPRVKLKILLGPRDYAGYAPSALLSAQSNTSANIWVLTVGTDLYPDGLDSTDFFEVGERVNVERFDGTVSAHPGIVTAVTATTVTVNFDGAWTPSTDDWVLNYADADDALLTADQKKFVFDANSTSMIEYASGNVPAKTFGP